MVGCRGFEPRRRESKSRMLPGYINTRGKKKRRKGQRKCRDEESNLGYRLRRTGCYPLHQRGDERGRLVRSDGSRTRIAWFTARDLAVGSRPGLEIGREDYEWIQLCISMPPMRNREDAIDKQTMVIAAGLEPGICGLKARHADLCTTRSNRDRIEIRDGMAISGERPRAAKPLMGQGFPLERGLSTASGGSKPPLSRCTTLAPRSQ